MLKQSKKTSVLGKAREAMALRRNRSPVKVMKLTKADVENAKLEQQINKIKRQGRLTAINEYIGFGVSKIAGTLALTVGGIEYLDPNILPIVLNNPEIVAGVGLALLTGKGIITLIAKVEKTFGGRE